MIVSRFAPAPTGFLHLGHVVNALHVWGITRAAGGRVLLRIEDHDRQRCRPEYERAILDDLDWLGLVPDEPATSEFRAGVCRFRQSDRHDIYEQALRALAEQRLVYACDCTRSEIRAAMTAADTAMTAADTVRRGSDPASAAGETGARDVEADAGDAAATELRYSGRCASRGLEPAPGRGVRVRLAQSVERFDDLAHGRCEQHPWEQCGDMLLMDRDGNWTYQFAVTVDDMAQGVNLVIRGDDLLASTGRQIQLARLLGRAEPPRFLHHALIMKTPTQKLSKAGRDTSVGDLRRSGLSVPAVVGLALHAAGLSASPRPLTPVEAGALIAARYPGVGRET